MKVFVVLGETYLHKVEVLGAFDSFEKAAEGSMLLFCKRSDLCNYWVEETEVK